jgi:bacterioferritin-associated ferredoxin
MYVCLCKGLTESDVAMTARVWAESGIEPDDVIELLGLRSEECCGYCDQHPQVLLDIVAAEMERPQAEVRRIGRPAPRIA